MKKRLCVFLLALSALVIAQPRGVIYPDDTVVYLSGNENAANYIGIENGHECNGGVCAGINDVHYALLSVVEFHQGVESDSNETIREKLIKATQTGRPVTIQGFYSLNHFVQRMMHMGRQNPLFAAVWYLQTISDFDRLPGGKAKTTYHSQPNFSASQNVDFWEGKVPNSVPQAKALEKSINQKHPVRVLVAYAEQPDVGHVFLAVGYVKHVGEVTSSFFLTVDSNFPGRSGYLLRDGNRWLYDGDSMGALLEMPTKIQARGLERRLDKVVRRGQNFGSIPLLQNNFPARFRPHCNMEFEKLLYLPKT